MSESQENDNQSPQLQYCMFCGAEITSEQQICPSCGKKIEGEKVRYSDENLEPGDWSLLSDFGATTKGVSFDVIKRWVERGLINKNSTIKGPTTNYMWKFASDIPQLSKYLGVCFNCHSRVSEDMEFCPRCKKNLDGKKTLPPEVEEDMQKIQKKKKYIRLKIAVIMVLVFLIIFYGIYFSGVHQIFPVTLRDIFDYAGNPVMILFDVIRGPLNNPAVKEQYERALSLREEKNFAASTTILKKLASDYAISPFAQLMKDELNKTYSTWIDNCRYLIEKHKHDEAFQQLMTLQKEPPGEDIAEAVDELLQTNLEKWITYAQQLIEEDLYQRAQNEFEKILEDYPNSAYAADIETYIQRAKEDYAAYQLYQKAKNYYAVNEFDKAKQLLLELKISYPDNKWMTETQRMLENIE